MKKESRAPKRTTHHYKSHFIRFAYRAQPLIWAYMLGVRA